MRADARRNYERIVATARDVFFQHGVEAPLDDVVKQAGVGAGTLYRHFPTRDVLIEAVYRSGTDGLAAAAEALLREHTAVSSLRAWMERFVEYMLTKQGMSDALPAILAAHDGLIAHTRLALIGGFPSPDGALYFDALPAQDGALAFPDWSSTWASGSG